MSKRIIPPSATFQILHPPAKGINPVEITWKRALTRHGLHPLAETFLASIFSLGMQYRCGGNKDTGPTGLTSPYHQALKAIGTAGAKSDLVTREIKLTFRPLSQGEFDRITTAELTARTTGRACPFSSEDIERGAPEATFFLIGTRRLIDHTVDALETEARYGNRDSGTTGIRASVFPGLFPPSKPEIGWLEIDNGVFIFRDRAASQKTAQLFGVSFDPLPTPESKPAGNKPQRDTSSADLK